MKTVVNTDDFKDLSWIEPLQKSIIGHLNEPDHKVIWLASNNEKNNGVAGLCNSLKREYINTSRFRGISDISLKKGNRVKMNLSLEDEEVERVLKLDMYGNQYRDGKWGGLRDIEIKEGKNVVRLQGASKVEIGQIK